MHYQGFYGVLEDNAAMIWFIIILLYCYLNSLTKKKAKDIFFFFTKKRFCEFSQCKM